MTITAIKRPLNTCKVCNYQWFSSKPDKIHKTSVCPHCGTSHWKDGNITVACQQCGYKWTLKGLNGSNIPEHCPKCHSTLWNKSRKSKVGSVPKGETYKLIVGYRNANPLATQSEMGRVFNISRERVRQILADAKLPSVAPKQQYTCLHCGAMVDKLLWGHFCSHKCYHKHHYRTLTCEVCGKEFERKLAHINRTEQQRARYKTGKVFCSKKCYGTWFGKHPKPNRRVDHSNLFEMYKNGAPIKDIATAGNLTIHSLFRLITEARRKGLDVPYRFNIDESRKVRRC